MGKKSPARRCRGTVSLYSSCWENTSLQVQLLTYITNLQWHGSAFSSDSESFPLMPLRISSWLQSIFFYRIMLHACDSVVNCCPLFSQLKLTHTHTHTDDVGVWVFFLTIKQDTSKTTVGQNYRWTWISSSHAHLKMVTCVMCFALSSQIVNQFIKDEQLFSFFLLWQIKSQTRLRLISNCKL